jgi:hypothetical protein
MRVIRNLLNTVITMEAIQKNDKFGSVGEWVMPAVLKTAAPHGAVGSNPTASAKIYPRCAGEADTDMAAPACKAGASSRPLQVRILPPAPEHPVKYNCEHCVLEPSASVTRPDEL